MDTQDIRLQLKKKIIDTEVLTLNEAHFFFIITYTLLGIFFCLATIITTDTFIEFKNNDCYSNLTKNN